MKTRLAKLLKWPMDEKGNPIRLKWWPENARFKFILDNAFWLGGAILIACAFFLAWQDEYISATISTHNSGYYSNRWQTAESELKENSNRFRDLQDAYMTKSNQLAAFVSASNISSSIVIQGSVLTNATLKTGPDTANNFNFPGGVSGGNNQFGDNNVMNLIVTNGDNIFNVKIAFSDESKERLTNGKYAYYSTVHLDTPFPIGNLKISVKTPSLESIQLFPARLIGSVGNLTYSRGSFPDGWKYVNIPNAKGDYRLKIVTTNEEQHINARYNFE